MPTARERITYCIANVAAVLAALYIAFWLDLDRPYWAMFTVFIVSKPISGAVRAKGIYRFAGSLVGASMSVFLVPPLVQSPVLLTLAASLWVGLCLFLALQDRTPRSYAFLLAGYSVAIVGLSTVNNPMSIFDVALSRLEEISIGIVCAAVAHTVFFPRNIGGLMREIAERAISQSGRIVAKAIAPDSSPPSLSETAAVASSVMDLHTLYSQTGFETSNVPRVPGIMVALLDRLALVLPTASLIHHCIVAIERTGPVHSALRSDLQDAALRILAISQGASDEAEAIAAKAPIEPDPLTDACPTESLALGQLIVAGLAEVSQALAECRRLAGALNEPAAAKEVSHLVPAEHRRPFYRDEALALLSAASASGAVLVASALWIEGAWPEGFVAAQFAAICCSLFATFDNPSKIIGAAVAGIVTALPVAAVYEFAILPGIDGFASLALVLTPMLLLFSYLQTFERLEGAAMVLAIAFAGALALQESFASDFASFVNSNLAEVIGPLIAVAMLLIFRTVDAVWNAKRILKSGQAAVRSLAHRRPGDIHPWIVQMLDRVGLAATRLAGAGPGVANQDILRDLRVGLGIEGLNHYTASLGLTVRTKVAELLTALSGQYGRMRAAPGSRPPADLLAGLAPLFQADGPPSLQQWNGIVALTRLRLELDPHLCEGGGAK